MKVYAEAYGLQLGVDNAILDALFEGKWGIRMSFTSSDNKCKQEIILTTEEAITLVTKLQNAIKSIDEVKSKVSVIL